MILMKIGIIKEGKIPVDKRVPLTPKQVESITSSNPEVEIVVESSNVRCYPDSDYQSLEIPVVTDISDCDVLLGVKEVPMDDLLPDKTYFFFSHTIKKQPYNRDLLRTILDRKIRLIDWETIRDENGMRAIAFGRWAGIVGAYNALWTFGQRYNLFEIRRAHTCFDYTDLQREYAKINLPKIKIALTGGGRVSRGAMEVLHGVGIKKVSPNNFLSHEYAEPVFTQLNSRDYNQRKDGAEFNRHHFFDHPEEYEGNFQPFTHVADILIAGAFWDPRAPRLFQKEDVTHGDYIMNVVADITCDIDGSIPSTKQPTTIDDPIYDYNPSEDSVEPAMSDEANITVMAVDNLPCELPRDASESFGDQFIENVLPALIGNDSNKLLEKATITLSSGSLAPAFAYLQDYVDGTE